VAVTKLVRKLIPASHGSKVDFDKFSDEFIGTGVGQQNYGHGIYFGHGYDNPSALNFKEVFKSGLLDVPYPDAKLFNVDLNLGADDLLIWHRPFSQQNPEVQRKLTDILNAHKGASTFRLKQRLAKEHGFDPSKTTGGHIYGALTPFSKVFGDVEPDSLRKISGYDLKAASDILSRGGIKGNLIEHTPWGYDAPHYAIFDPSVINIVNKYGLGALGLGGLLSDDVIKQTLGTFQSEDGFM
jgi:hypothetical protein